MIETGRYTSVLFCLQFRISIYIYASGPCSCRDLTDETYIFEPYCKSVRLPPPHTNFARGAAAMVGGCIITESLERAARLCVCVCLTLLYYSAASLILLLHHSGAKHKNQKKNISKDCTQDRIVIHLYVVGLLLMQQM